MVDFGSSVISDLNLSNKAKNLSAGKYSFGEKRNSGGTAAYMGGIDYKKQVYKGQTNHTFGVGVFSFGGNISWDTKGNITDWFVGWDPSVKGAIGIGLEGNLRVGFSK